MNNLIVFIGNALSRDLKDVSDKYEIVSVRGATGTLIKDNERFNFIVVNRAEQLKGLRFDYYEFLPSSADLKLGDLNASIYYATFYKGVSS